MVFCYQKRKRKKLNMKSVKILKIARVVLHAIFGFIIVACVTGFLLFKFLNLNFYIILSGSMQPELNVDDLIIVQSVNETEAFDKLQVGDIATYFDGKSPVTHRVYEASKNEDGVPVFIFKGDNNNVVDRNSVSASQIRGKYLFKISNGGSMLEFLKSPYGFVTVGSILFLLFVLDNTFAYIIQMKQEKLQKDDNNSQQS